MLLTFVFAPGLSYGDVSKENIRAVQQVLKGCGFNPGALDGIWGNKTTAAAKSYLRAHGSKPSDEGYNYLMAQVDFYRVGDDGPCPPARSNQAAESESGPADKAGSVEPDQAEESEVGGEGAAYAELTELLDGKKTDPDRDRYGDPLAELQIVEEDKSLLIREQQICNGGGCIWHFPLSELKAIYLEELDRGPEGASVFGFLCRDETECGQLADYGPGERDAFDDKIHYEAVASGRESVKSYTWEDRNTTGWDIVHYYHNERHGHKPMFTREEEKRIVAALDKFHKNINQSTGQSAKCYNWVNLGTFHLGTWVNGNGHRTESLTAGLSTKIWNDDELWDDYQTIRKHCVDSANFAMDSAVSAMVVVGRKAKDVEDEKIRIRNFYKANLDMCQAEFDKRYDKYANKFCN